MNSPSGHEPSSQHDIETGKQRHMSDTGSASWPALILAAIALPFMLSGLGSYSVVNGDEQIYHEIARNMVEISRRRA